MLAEIRYGTFVQWAVKSYNRKRQIIDSPYEIAYWWEEIGYAIDS